MLKTKYRVILLLLLLSTSLIRAELLQTSNELSNLEIVTDTDCSRVQYKTRVATQEPVKEQASEELPVETVNYKLHACDGVTSFPVTVRTHKLQGSHQ